MNITLEKISKVYGSASDTPAVDGVDLRVESGEFFFLLGPSGCGKTTLLRMIAGLIEPTSGRILFGDRDVTRLSVEQRRTALVFQNYALWPHMTVAANVEFGPRMRGVARARRRELARVNLERVQMTEYSRRRPSQLSGGQQQRVAVARALAAEPDCLLLDEPLSNLDAKLRLSMREQLREIVKSANATAVYVTHDQKEALSMADRIAVMNQGRIEQVGSPEALYNRPCSRFVADFLGETNLLTGAWKAAGAGRVLFQSVFGECELDASAMPDAGERSLLCCIRPERVRLTADAAPSTANAPSVRAELIRGTYLGDGIQYRCRLPDGVFWKVHCSGVREPLADGCFVTLSVSPEDLVPLPGG